MKNDGLVFLIWIVILAGIGYAVYFGFKNFNNKSAYVQLEQEKKVLQNDGNTKSTNNKSTNNSIINSIIKKKKTGTNSTTTNDNTKSSTTNSSTSTQSKQNNNSNTKSTNSETKSNSSNNSTSSNNSSSSSSESSTTNYQTQTPSSSNSEQPSSTTRELVSVEDVTETTVLMEKYGTKHLQTAKYKLYKYSDGTEEKKVTKLTDSYDKSGYNGTPSILLPEARQVLSANYNDYASLNNIINSYRQEVGSNPLGLDQNLCLAATVRAMERAYAFPPEYVGHSRPNGSDFYTILDELGISKGKITGENVTAGIVNGTRIPADVYPYQRAAQDWYNSPGHKANLQDSRYNLTGIGAYQLGNTKYWVQLFIQSN